MSATPPKHGLAKASWVHSARAFMPRLRLPTNLGSSFGTAIAGTILVSALFSGNGSYVAATVVLAAVAVGGLVISTRLPGNPAPVAESDAGQVAAVVR